MMEHGDDGDDSRSGNDGDDEDDEDDEENDWSSGLNTIGGSRRLGLSVSILCHTLYSTEHNGHVHPCFCVEVGVEVGVGGVDSVVAWWCVGCRGLPILLLVSISPLNTLHNGFDGGEKCWTGFGMVSILRWDTLHHVLLRRLCCWK